MKRTRGIEDASPARSEEDGGNKKSKKNPNLLPTQDEQKQLKQIDILLKNNLLNLECKELLAETKEKSKQIISSKKLQELVLKLTDDLKNTSKTSCHGREISFDWVQAQNYVGLERPLSVPTSFNDTQFSIIYQSPQSVDVIGSFRNQTLTAPDYNIDIAVVIPNGIINSRY